MVAEGHSEAKGNDGEMKKEQHNTEAAAAWRQQRRGADGTSAAQRSWAHVVQCCSMTVSPRGQRDLASRKLQWWVAT